MAAKTASPREWHGETPSFADLIEYAMYDAARRMIRHWLGRPAVALAAAFPTPLTIGWMRAICWIQLTTAELVAVTGAIRACPRCRLLVFGVGNDSCYWLALNDGGTTLFLEHDLPWREAIAADIGTEPILTVAYSSRLDEWPEMIDQPSRLAMNLPPAVRDARWDVIVVDAPPGRQPSHPGRMQSIYESSRLVSPTGHVFVHDCHRPAERAYTDRFLGNSMTLTSDRRLRHYRSPTMSPLPGKPSAKESSTSDTIPPLGIARASDSTR